MDDSSNRVEWTRYLAVERQHSSDRKSYQKQGNSARDEAVVRPAKPRFSARPRNEEFRPKRQHFPALNRASKSSGVTGGFEDTEVGSTNRVLTSEPLTDSVEPVQSAPTMIEGSARRQCSCAARYGLNPEIPRGLRRLIFLGFCGTTLLRGRRLCRPVPSGQTPHFPH